MHRAHKYFNNLKASKHENSRVIELLMLNIMLERQNVQRKVFVAQF